MSARPSWSLDDINPKVRERAEDSARRAGMTVGDWLNATIGDAAASTGVGRSPFDTREPPRETMTAQQRLNSIARQFDSGTRPAKNESPEPTPRADARLSHYAESAAAARTGNPYGPRSSGAISLEAAIAEISARQAELATPAEARTLVPSSKLSTLERQISHIMTQMESLPNPGLIEESIASFRADLSDIRKTITEAMPRRAIESIESEVRTLSQRIDESRERGADAHALAGVEKGLDQIRESLKTLMPAEQLAGFDEAIRNLANQLDSVVRGGSDATVLNQLEEAIASLRVIVSKVASNEALSTLGGDVRSLAAKLDEFANSGGFGESLAALETRIVSLASFLQKRDRADGGSEGSAKMESALRALSDRLDHMPAGAQSPAGFAQLDARMSNLLDRLEAISGNPGLNRVEEGLQDIRRQLEERRTQIAAAGEGSSRVLDPSLVDTVKRELSDIRLNLTVSERHTLESLEVVNNTLGHVVDRLAMIEGDLRGQSVQPKMPSSPLAAAAAAIAQSAAVHRPEMPNPAAHRSLHETVAPPLQPRSIAPDLPPDTPLEPGSRSAGRLADEIEAQADETPQDGTSTSSFIAAARRAARAAAAAAPQADKAKRAPAKSGEGGESTLASKIRSLLVGASVVVIVVGSFRMAMTMLDGASQPSIELPAASGAPSAPSAPGKQSSMMAPAPKSDPFFNAATVASAGSDVTGSIGAQAAPEASRPDQTAALSRASVPTGETLPDTIGIAKLRDAALKGDAGAAFEIGARYAEARGVAANFPEAAKWYERSAQAGIAPAAFRLGAMYEKGVGVKKDLDVARRYYEQAADRGNAKAMHNLAVLDADGGGSGANFKSASQWFRKAAERGVVDSQYNLGILYARGIGVEQNLAESFKWFSLAAAQGDADSAAKRDDVAKKIDPQSMAAAKLAIQTFTPEPQPAEATNLAIPVGGWDGPAQQTAAAKPAPARKLAPR